MQLFRMLTQLCGISTVVYLSASLLTVQGRHEAGIKTPPPAEGEPTDGDQLHPTTDEARRHAKVLHTTIDSALRMTHDRYYREDEGLPIPALALKDVFADLESKEEVLLRWLAVEGQAMNTEHIATTDFEKLAVEALKSGKSSHEQVSENTFRVAMPIALSNHCLKCHMPDRKSTKDRTAGLIISMPIKSR